MSQFKLVFTIIFMFVSGLLAAQVTSATLSGKVSDGNFPVANAAVTLIYLPTNSSYETNTDKKGRFSLDNLDVGGPYRIIVKSKDTEDYSNSNMELSLGNNDLIKTLVVQRKESAMEQVSVSEKNVATKTN